MNKAIVIVLASMLLLGVAFVSAQAQDGTGPYHDEVIAAGGMNGTDDAGQGQALGVKVKAGDNITAPNGETVQVRGEGNKIRLRVGDIEADADDLNITSDGQKLHAKLSNGRNAEIKIMPDTASERALTRLRLKVCNETKNCTIELKQVGTGNQTRLAYEVQAERHSRILGLFQAKMQVRAQVDAENGEVISVGKPWWAFLATEPQEE
jgi:hypothetical protein